MAQLEKDNYQYVENVLTEEEQALLNNYCKLYHFHNFKEHDFSQCTGESFQYACLVMEALLKSKQPLFEKVIGKKILPTYSFWRMYNYLSDLKPHSDRAACEISCTVCIGNDGTPWPIYMGDNPVEVKPGDGVVYHGPKINHYRKEFKGDWHNQVFLHYVYADGENTKEVNDKKGFLGQANYSL